MSIDAATWIRLLALDAPERHFAQYLDLRLVRESVEERLIFSPHGHESVCLELRQVLRDCGLRDTEDFAEVAHADFPDLVEQVKEPEPCGLSHRAQNGRPLVQIGRECHRL